MKNVIKTSKDGMPAWDGMFSHILIYLKEKNTPTERRVIVKEVADSLNLSLKMRNKTYESEQGNNVIENRLAFTISSLKRGGLIDNVSRGVFQITSLGKSLVSKYGYNLDRDIVESTEEFKNYNFKKDNKNLLLDENDTDTGSLEIMESIDEKISEAREKRKEELYEIIINSSPYLFEKIVVILLSEMGYKGKDGESFVTQKSNDGGIDGFIHHDPLGTQTVYIQAKRYNERNKVQRPDIETFYGALSSINANRGVLITTSYFTKSAQESAERLSIILIDKDQLMDLLIDYEVGIEKDKVFYTYKISDDFFDAN